MTEGEHIHRHLPELNYSIEAWPLIEPTRAKAYVMEFIVRTIYTYTDRTIGYQRADSPTSPDPTPDLALAEWHIRGSVKWDGCANYEHNQACLLHICGPGDLDDEHEAMRTVYRMAHEMLSANGGHVAFERP